MDYRVKYRDIPWGVALSVLPGKIIGTWFIKPGITFRCNWRDILMRWLKKLLILVAVLVIILVIITMIEIFSEGLFSAWIEHIWSVLNE